MRVVMGTPFIIYPSAVTQPQSPKIGMTVKGQWLTSQICIRLADLSPNRRCRSPLFTKHLSSLSEGMIAPVYHLTNEYLSNRNGPEKKSSSHET